MTINVQTGATITSDGATTLQPSGTLFNGAVALNNAGTLGVLATGTTAAAPVNFFYSGTPAATTNSFALTNSGVISGVVNASGVGGAITASNTGTIAGGLVLTGSGPITLTSSGPVYVANGGSGSTAVNLQSFRSVQATTGTPSVDGLTTTTVTGGLVTATITAPVAIPAVGTTAAVPQGVSLFGIGGAQLSLNALAGAVNVATGSSSSSFIPGGSNIATAGGVTTATNSNTTTAVGGAANATIGADAQIAGLNVSTGPSAASASLAGAVGTSTAGGNVTVNSQQNDSSFSNTATSSATGSTFASTSRTTPVGGAVTIDQASTGRVFGSVSAASNRGPAAVTIAGNVGAGNGTTIATLGNVNATSVGTGTVTQQNNNTMLATGDFANITTTNRTATGATSAVTIASTGNVFGSVSATASGGTSLDNAGRVRNGATVTSSRTVQTLSNTRNSQTTTASSGGAQTIATANSSATTNTAIGGAATLVNRAGSVIGDLDNTDTVNVSGLAGATLTNAGAIFGNVNLTSSGSTTTLTTNGTTFAPNVTTTTTPAAAGGNTVVTVQSSASTSSAIAAGGIATGDYSGTVGAAQGSTLATSRSVSQFGDAGSTATIGGVLYANFSGQAGTTNSTGSATSTTTTTTQPFTAPATPASETVTSTQNRNAATQTAGNSAATVTGALRNNGTGTGSLSLFAANGAVTATVTGGTVDGGITVNGGFASNTTSGSDTASRSTIAATTAGPVPTEVAQSATSTSFSTNQGAAGSGAVTLTRATVGGSVGVFGRGTGAGSTAASLTMSSDSTVAGTVQVVSSSPGDSRTDNSTIDARTAANAINRVVTAATTQTLPTSYGNVTATLAGRTGAATVFSSFGTASATLAGQVVGGVSVTTGQTLNNSSSQTNSSGTSTTAFVFPTPTGSTSSSSSTWSGGAASLAINTAAALQATNTSATSGTINVAGVGGSTLTIAVGSRVNAGNTGSVFVGSNFFNSTNQQANTFTAGTQTGQTNTNTRTVVGGAASLTNAGVIGTSTGYLGSPLTVAVQSVGGASATNSGTIYGSLNANALGLNSTGTTTSIALNDSVQRRDVTTTTNTGAGGTAAVTNSGVVSGAVSVAGATGTVTNTGVLRNGIALGQAVSQFSRTDTQTATSATVAATVPATRFAQTYTVNQSGLLFGGINVTGAVIGDPSTGAAANATLRTSDITTTLNLNAGSITTGNVTAQVVSATDNTRLTNTTLRLNDNGFLGVGTSDTPSSTVGFGAATPRFVNTPNFGTYLVTDPALGTLSGTTFDPSVFVSSGVRVTGVTLVEKTGAGVFTVVGASYVAPTAANSFATYTMDVGTFRNGAGELQLGVIDSGTSAGVFGIRGNMENNAQLTLGRRVTDGSSTVLQGLAVRVDGNYTQSATGTLSVAATPALVRSFGTSTEPATANGSLGFANYGISLSPFVAYDPTNTNSLRSTPSTMLVNGNATLAGAVTVNTTPGAIYTAGRVADVITVTGTYSATGLRMNSGISSPFITFALSPRTVGSTTVVSLDVTRNAYSSVATNTNVAAAAAGLQATIPNVISRITAIRNPTAVTDVQSYGQLQDLATVIAGLDTQLSAADAATAFNQLGSASFYGSLQAVSTTAPFGEAVDQLPATAGSGIGLWFRPTGQFARIDGDANTGAQKLRADNYGGSAGFAVSTGNGSSFGIGGGYGRIKARPVGYPALATADTYMIGAYGGVRVAGVNLGAQAVFGWSNWDATRSLPIFARTAAASFDSKEFRFTARASYDFDLAQALVSPFAKIDARRYSFNSFEEGDAGGIGLAVAKRTDTVWNPELGVRLSGSFNGIQPFAEGSYVFQGNVKGYRTVSYLGDTTNSFRLEGVDPDGFVKLGVGVQADVYGATLYLRGNYLTSGGVSTGEAQGGLVIRF
ncbi:hypothetical protein [Sphingomonas sp. CFBP 8760]|uniref:hypothetical protein n=1 Tax=Sphingomonas sp. CFBP 8760 TaxID=2775282 RepID=UPI001A90EC3D|nr:hypothetical protein [Sphingomonas sp. CFBP 8760]